MSEAILYAIDAPDITDAATAVRFVDQHKDSMEPPTEKIASFFENLLLVWPEDGSRGQIWYEDFTHNRPGGCVLEMTFELSEFNQGRLDQLRAISEEHGVHVLDSEGEVVYLADGSEAGT